MNWLFNLLFPQKKFVDDSVPQRMSLDDDLAMLYHLDLNEQPKMPIYQQRNSFIPTVPQRRGTIDRSGLRRVPMFDNALFDIEYPQWSEKRKF